MALPLIAGIIAGVGSLASLASTLTKKPPQLKYKYQSGTPDPMLSYLPDYRAEPMRKAYEYVEPKNIASKILGVAGTVLGATGTALGAAGKGKGPKTDVTKTITPEGRLGTGTFGVEPAGWKLPELPVTAPKVENIMMQGTKQMPITTTAPFPTTEDYTRKIPGLPGFDMPSEGPIKPESMLVAQPTTVPRPTKAPFSSTPELTKLPEFKGWNTDIFKRIPALTTLWGSDKGPDWMNFQNIVNKQYPKQY